MRRILKLSLSVALAGGALTGAALAAPGVAGAGVVAPPGGAIVVGVAGPSCPSPSTSSIQTAINSANPGATIYVCAGTYNESLTINEPLTLLGAQYGVDARTRSAEPETIIDGSGGIQYTSGATTGTVSGFTLNGYTGSVGEIQAANVGSAWTFTDNLMDVSNGGIYFNTDGVVNPAATTIADNKFTQSVGSEAGSGDYGQAVLIWQQAGDNVTISNNDFSDLSGPGANINTTGSSCATSSNDLTISDNTSEENGTYYDDNLVALFCTTDASITGNTFTITDPGDTNAVGPIFLGGGNYTTLVSGNTFIGNGAPYASAIGVGTAYYANDDNTTVENNTVTGWGDNGGDGQGIVVYGTSSGFTIEGNSLTDNGDGIWITPAYGGLPSGTVTGNYVHGSITNDCQDDTSGSGTASTNDTWSDNIGVTSSPAGLCGQVASTTVSTPSVGHNGTLRYGSNLTDSALVSGIAAGPAPTGSVTFTVCGPTNAVSCSNYTTTVGTSSFTGSSDDTATAVSPAFHPTAVGTWCFKADYSVGDSNYLPSADTSTTECFTVTKASTTTKSGPSNRTIYLGQADNDRATVTGNAGGGSPTGSVKFYECGVKSAPTSCASTAHEVGGKVSAGAGGNHSSAATSAPFTPSAVGYWCFSAHYSGSTRYLASSDTTVDECVHVIRR
jgi:nitrous oxidase accessory protein NosD